MNQSLSDDTSSYNYKKCLDVFYSFLILGLSCFGGPVAHIAYFRRIFVEQKCWLSEHDYADVVALCQFLPGPASSQVALALGLMRAGPWGAVAAWIAFTLPSAFMMIAIASGLMLTHGIIGNALMHGLKLVTIAIVAQAVWSMARQFCSDYRRMLIALFVFVMLEVMATSAAQIFMLMMGTAAGYIFCRSERGVNVTTLPTAISIKTALICLLLYITLLVFELSFSSDAHSSESVILFNAFYRAGALVFGGGHVVLPLLQSAIVDKGWINVDQFIAGYGATQAMPGPLFTFAAYLGASVHIGPGGIIGAFIALIAIFIPGVLILLAALPFWARMRQNEIAHSLIIGAHASVVGILGFTLYSTLIMPNLNQPIDILISAGGFILAISTRLPPWTLVCFGLISGMLITYVWGM
jgi:chromate transporter